MWATWNCGLLVCVEYINIYVSMRIGRKVAIARQSTSRPAELKKYSTRSKYQYDTYGNARYKKNNTPFSFSCLNILLKTRLLQRLVDRMACRTRGMRNYGKEFHVYAHRIKTLIDRTIFHVFFFHLILISGGKWIKKSKWIFQSNKNTFIYGQVICLYRTVLSLAFRREATIGIASRLTWNLDLARTRTLLYLSWISLVWSIEEDSGNEYVPRLTFEFTRANVYLNTYILPSVYRINK